MPACTVCGHAQVAEIDEALQTQAAPLREIGRKHGVSKDALSRHRRGHLAPSALVAVPQDGRLVRRLENLEGRLEELDHVLDGLLRDARRRGNVAQILATVQQIRLTVETVAKLRGQLDQRPVVNVLALPAFQDHVRRLQRALRDFPEAREAVTQALTGGDDGAA